MKERSVFESKEPDAILIDMGTQEQPKVYILRKQYEKLDPAVVSEMNFLLVPVERDEMDRLRQESAEFTKATEAPKIPDFIWQDAVQHAPAGVLVKGCGTPRVEPKGHEKKKKAKRRQQKTARRRNK